MCNCKDCNCGKYSADGKKPAVDIKQLTKPIVKGALIIVGVFAVAFIASHYITKFQNKTA